MGDHGESDRHGDGVDGCLCDISLEASEIVSDEELPPTSGGVQIEAATDAVDRSDDAEGVPDNDVTTDVELPPATGGVE